jgi:hypothetical protein
VPTPPDQNLPPLRLPRLAGRPEPKPDAPPTGSPAPTPAATPAAQALTYTLNPQLKQGLQTAWSGSLPEGKAREQGGILVQKADSTYEWRAGVGSGSESFSTNYGDLKTGETLVATAHTHPYSAAEGGYRDVSFSGGDLGNMALASRPENMKFVQSGDTVFMVQKTQAFKDLVAEKGENVTRAAMVSSWNTARAAATGTFAERVEAATKAVCKEYHLDYYRGSGDTLTQVDVSK